MTIEGLIFGTVIIVVLILLNGFFSSSEIAIISAKRSIIDKLAREGNRSASIVARMKEDPERFLATVQVGVTIAGSLASAIGGIIAIKFLEPLFLEIPVEPVRRLAEYMAVGVTVVVISYATLVVGELAPKSIALRYADRVACFSARPLDLLSRLSGLFVKVLTKSNEAVLKIFGVKEFEKRHFISEEEIKFFIKEGRATGVFEETEAALLHGVFEFADTTVKEVMVPKPKFSGIEVNTTPEKVLRYMTEAGFSRYPVYRGTPENVIGVLFNKDVYRAVEHGRAFTIIDLMRPPYFVPDTVMISRLLRELQRRKVHMAIVVDEHGEVDGLVTIEALLNQSFQGRLHRRFVLERHLVFDHHVERRVRGQIRCREPMLPVIRQHGLYALGLGASQPASYVQLADGVVFQ